jgi:hypothetical protein
MQNEILAFIKNSGADLRVWQKDAVAHLVAHYEHYLLFKVISDYMYQSSVSRYEWIICIYALCEIDKVEANKRFVGALKVEDANKRFRVVKLLRSCGTEIVVPALIKILKEDPEPGIRVMAADTLGYIGDEQAIPALEWSVENDDGRDHDDNAITDVAQRAIERLNAKVE